MPRSGVLRMRFLVLLTTLLVLAGCGGSDADHPPPAGANGDLAGNAQPDAPVVVPDACTFFSRAELESTVGWELREGEPEDVSAGSACDFEMPPGMYVTRTFPDPALPESVGFSSLTINTHPSDAANFAEWRELAGTGIEEAPGIGDDAYFNGPDMLHVRVGNRGFSLRLYTNAGTDADWAAVREVLLTLARLGVSRL